MLKKDVIEHFGGTAKTAVALNITHPAVCRWGEIIPEKRAYAIERLTKGKLKHDAKMYEKNTVSVSKK